MKNKWLLISLTTASFPYFIIFAFCTIFFSTQLPFFRFVMETIFKGNALSLLFVAFALSILFVVLVIVCLTISIKNDWDPVLLSKTALLIKLIQVPAYLIIFFLGIVCVMTLFTIPFAIGLLLIDCVSLFLSGIFVVSSAINAARRGIIERKTVGWILVSQLFFLC